MTPEETAKERTGQGTETHPAPGGPVDGTEEPQETRFQRLVRSKSFIPTAVVAGLLLLVLLSSRLTGRPPVLDRIQPATGRPGDILVVEGKYFGTGKDAAEVRISGVSPTSKAYKSRTDGRIIVEIPEETGSGLVYVINKNGRSDGQLFINLDQVPQILSGPSRPGEPYIRTIEPQAAKIGERIVIRGMNFGLEMRASRVQFAWVGGGQGGSAGEDLSQLIAARVSDLDYMSWSDSEIAVRVPDGASSGNVLVTSDKGRSNSLYFEVLAGAGSKIYPKKRTYSVQYGVQVAVTAAAGDNLLYLWLPRVPEAPEQKNIRLVAQEPKPLLDDVGGAALFALSNLQKGQKAKVSMSFLFDRYRVETQVTAARVPLSYDGVPELFKKFTAPDDIVPAGNPKAAQIAKSAAEWERNPYLKARLLYDWMLSKFAYARIDGVPDVNAAFDGRKGGAYLYAAVYCALLRAAGIPSRMVGGYLAGDANQPTQRHFWDEFYVDGFGWVPVDPLLGDEKQFLPLSLGPELDNREFYFGSLDEYHIAVTKGRVAVSQMNPEGRTVRKPNVPFLLSIHEEATGGLTGYSTVLQDLEVQGIY